MKINWGIKKSIFVFIFLTTSTYFVLHYFYVPQFIDYKSNFVESLPLPEIPAWHSELLVADLHADTLLWNRDLKNRSSRGHVDIPRMIQGNMALQGFSMVTQAPPKISYQGNPSGKDNIFWLAIFQGWPFSSWTNLSNRAFFQIDRLSQAVRTSENFFLIQNKEDLENYLQQKIKRKKITAGWLSLEGSQALGQDLSLLDQYFAAGVRMISPAHLTDNLVGGSQQGMQGYGLTKFGFQWLKKMNELQMIVDLAHASEKVISDVLKNSNRPVIVSHTGVKGTCDNNRNLSDETLREIAQAGGLVGIGFWEGATCGKTIHDIVKAILYTKNLIGFQHVALGSDWDGFVSTPLDVSQIGALTGALEKAGLQKNEIAQIMGENVFEFLLKNLPSSKR